jgi:hypothetical protein
MASFLLGLFASDLIKSALIVAPKTMIARALGEGVDCCWTWEKDSRVSISTFEEHIA